MRVISGQGGYATVQEEKNQKGHDLSRRSAAGAGTRSLSVLHALREYPKELLVVLGQTRGKRPHYALVRFQLRLRPLLISRVSRVASARTSVDYTFVFHG